MKLHFETKVLEPKDNECVLLYLEWLPLYHSLKYLLGHSHSVNNFPLHPTLDVTRAPEVVMIVALFQKNRYTTSEEYTDIHPNLYMSYCKAHKPAFRYD